MKPEIKQKWVDALRGGEFKQVYRTLRRSGGYCCLGVLCDLHRKEVGGEWTTHDSYLGCKGAVPDEVAKWAGLLDGNPTVDGYLLSSHNDGGASFIAIADMIEKHL